MGFVVCAACSRHVKASETACPFCNASAFTRPAVEPFRRMALGAAMAASVTAACGGSVISGTSSGTSEASRTSTRVMETSSSTGAEVSVVGFYGAPFPQPTSSTSESSSYGFPSNVVFYGAPFPEQSASSTSSSSSVSASSSAGPNADGDAGEIVGCPRPDGAPCPPVPPPED